MKQNVQAKKPRKAFYFETDGETFSAISRAREFAGDNDFSVGSMYMDYPIGLAKGDIRISKWGGLGGDVEKLDGIIIPDTGFRNGGAVILLF